MWKQKLMWVAWPAFLGACALELLVFAVVDPGDLQWSGQPVGLSRQGVYTAAFFVFWMVGAVSGALTTLLAMSSAQVNSTSDPAGEPPGKRRPG